MMGPSGPHGAGLRRCRRRGARGGGSGAAAPGSGARIDRDRTSARGDRCALRGQRQRRHRGGPGSWGASAEAAPAGERVASSRRISTPSRNRAAARPGHPLPKCRSLRRDCDNRARRPRTTRWAPADCGFWPAIVPTLRRFRADSRASRRPRGTPAYGRQVRATSPPPALPVAAAAVVLVAAVLAPLAVPSAALAERWLRPVPGEVARSFAYDRDAPFAAGAHRGADLAAPPGTAVRAACAGRVIHAGTVAGRDNVVSVRCGARRVSYLPLARVAVAAGARIRAGAPIGTVAAGHGGLHVGVRHEGDPFGYIDPEWLLRAPGDPFVPGPPPVPRRPVPRAAPRPVVARPLSPRAAPRPVVARPLSPRAAAPRSAPAPWPVWAGLALLAGGAAGSGSVALRAAGAPPARACRWPRRRASPPGSNPFGPIGSTARGCERPAASLRRPRWPSTSPRPSTT